MKPPLLLLLATIACAQQIPQPQQVAILRQINHVNDDGSYTYGYEAADGSFKIETRDVLGNVRGMFGFVDENGRQRRVSYSAGNATGFQTTGQPPTADSPTPVSVTPKVILAEHPILRAVRPLPPVPIPAGHSGGRDSVAKLIRHLGIIGAKQAGSHRFLYASEDASSTTNAPVTTTAAASDGKNDNGKSDQVTTRRPTVVQRIVRTRPRTESTTRKDESTTIIPRRITETTSVRTTTEKREELDEADDVKSADLESLQRRPLAALKVNENAATPRFVILPSRLLRWRPSSEDDHEKIQREDEKISFRPESIVRPRLVGVPGQRDSPRYRLRQPPREQLTASQTPQQIFAQKGDPNPDFQNQQYVPQKNVFEFLTNSPRSRLVQGRPMQVTPPIHPEGLPPMYRQIFEPNDAPNEQGRLLFHDGNYGQKIQQPPPPPPPYLPQHQMIYPQKPLDYNVDPGRYGPYYPRPNSFVPNPQGYPIYGQRSLLELLLAYLQLQSKSPPHQGEYVNQLTYDPNNIVARQHYTQVGAGFQPPAILLPYPTPLQQFQVPYNNVAAVSNNYDFPRLVDPRALIRPVIIRQPLEVQNRLPRPILYGNGLDLSYAKNKENGYPEDLYLDPRNVNPRQGVAVRPAPLQLQPLFYERVVRAQTTPHQPEYPTYQTRQGPALGVTTVAPRSATEVPPPPENQGLPYGFTKKFRSVEVISPVTEVTTQKNSKND